MLIDTSIRRSRFWRDRKLVQKPEEVPESLFDLWDKYYRNPPGKPKPPEEPDLPEPPEEPPLPELPEPPEVPRLPSPGDDDLIEDILEQIDFKLDKIVDLKVTIDRLADVTIKMENTFNTIIAPVVGNDVGSKPVDLSELIEVIKNLNNNVIQGFGSLMRAQDQMGTEVKTALAAFNGSIKADIKDLFKTVDTRINYLIGQIERR